MKIRILLLTAILIVVTSKLYSQTNPSPFNLQNGDYSFQGWAFASMQGKYPGNGSTGLDTITGVIEGASAANMVFWRTGTQDPTLAAIAASDYTGTYNLGSGARVNGHDTLGASFINTGTSGNLGMWVLALNTTGRSNINLSYVMRTITPNPRIYKVRLQYRISPDSSWNDYNPLAEYESNTVAGHSENFGPLVLPAECNDKPNVQLRWFYYYISGSGARSQIALDDIFVTSSASGGVAQKFAIASVNNGVYPTAGVPFSILVQAQDNNGDVQNVIANTSFNIAIETGTGTLGGTLNGTINAGTSSVTVSGITYSPAQNGVSLRAFRTAGDNLNPGFSSLFDVLPPASKLAFVTTGSDSSSWRQIVVQALRPNDELDPTFTGEVQLSVANGPGVLLGDVTVNAIGGIATFKQVRFAEGGTYSLNASSGGLAQAISDSFALVAVKADVLPRFMQGLSGTNNLRTPFAYRLTLTGLAPNVTYRAVNQIVVSTTDGLSTNGAGNVIYPSNTGDFSRSSSPGFVNPGTYLEFTSDAQGSYSGWFITEPSGNARFAAGGYVFIRIRLNDGAGSTTPNKWVTTCDSVQVINYGVENNQQSGTGVWGNSNADSKTFVMVYDNVEGNGRPLSGTFVENDGSANTAANGYAPFYSDSVNSVVGAYGLIVPNNLPNGIRRVENRSLTTGNVIIAATDTDGNWTDGPNTVNPTGGSANPIYFSATVAPIPVELVSFSASTNGNIVSLNWETASETQNFGFEIERSVDNLTWTRIGFVDGAGNSTTLRTYSYSDNYTLSGIVNYRLKQLDFDGTYAYSDVINIELNPVEFALMQNYPNPFNPSTVIKFSLAQDAKVLLTVYNVIGEKVALLLNNDLKAGTHQVEFNASYLTSGIYFYELKTNKGFESMKKMMLVK